MSARAAAAEHYPRSMNDPEKRLLVRQYAEFSVQSTVVTSAEMAEALGMEPDSVLVRGSRQVAPPRPVWHIWTVRAQDGGDLGQQVEGLVGRLRPVEAALHSLVHRITSDPEDYGLAADQRGGATLSLVRYFHDEDGQAEQLGWHVSPAVLGFLNALDASIDVDEYDHK